MRLAGKVAVVTGGGRGSGRGIVMALAREGADVKMMVDRTREVFGKIDILVNNAGMAGPTGMPFTNNTEEDGDKTFAVNTKSVFLTCKAIAPYFIERTGLALNVDGGCVTW